MKRGTIKLPEDVIGYFKAQSKETGTPYQILISFYLTDYTKNDKYLKAFGISDS